jgi:hypothetical protein
MNKAFPTTQVAWPASAGDAHRSNRVLSELLSMNEEMILQLRVERAEAHEATGFITGMIEQHESAAESLRAELKSQRASVPVPPTPFLDNPLPC